MKAEPKTRAPLEAEPPWRMNLLHEEALCEDAYRFPRVWEPAPVRDRVYVAPFDIQSALLRGFI